MMQMSTYAQVVVVSNMKQNVVYLGINNPLKIAMEGTYCSNLNVRTDNGKITKTGNCEYNFIPEKKGMAQIVVRSSKKTYNYLLRVEDLPQPLAFIGGSTGGLMTKDKFLNHNHLYIRYPGLDTKTGLTISSFSYQVFRESAFLFGNSIKGPHFSREMQQQFQNLMKNDMVLFYGIVAIDDQGNFRTIPPLQLIIN